jgi:hypothetical protein
MFFGILVLSFIIERLFEIVSSIMDYLFAGSSEKKWGIKVDIIETKAKEFEPIKRLIFTPAGLLIGYIIVGTVGVGECGILHCTSLCEDPTKYVMLDKVLTAVAISGGTGPIHSFMDVLRNASKNNTQDNSGSAVGEGGSGSDKA